MTLSGGVLGGGVIEGGRCRPCGLWIPAQNRGGNIVIPGEGDATPGGLALLGEGPGQEEEQTGRPFVGRAGQILNRALMDANLNRASIWVTNAVRCRPTNAKGYNRTPTPTELGHCRGWLDQEMDRVRPKIIVALGASAAWAALAPNVPAGGVLENQGKVFWSERYHCWVLITFHPAYIARKLSEYPWLVLDLMKADRILKSGELPTSSHAEFVVVETLEQAFTVRELLLALNKLAFDWETNGLNPVQAKGFLASFCGDGKIGYLFPRYRAGFEACWTRSELRTLDQEVLVPLFTSDIPKVGHHVGFDAQITKSTLGVWPKAIVGDTMIKHHLLYNHMTERVRNLKRLSEVYTTFGRYDDPIDEWLIQNGYTKDGKPDGAFMYLIPDTIMRPYAATDSVVTWIVDAELDAPLDEAGLRPIYDEERMPLVLEYTVMDRDGVRISRPKLEALAEDLDSAIVTVNAALERHVGYPLNYNSFKQVAAYLFDEMGQPVMGVTDTGQPSTKEEYLLPLLNGPCADVIQLLLHGRAYSKMQGTFITGSKKSPGGIKAAVGIDGFAPMYTHLAATETFRLATRKPFPIHTIPRPLPLWSCSVHGKYQFEDAARPRQSPCCTLGIEDILNIRSLIIPDGDEYVFLVADYVQQEYVILAVVSGQRDWEIAMLDEGVDAHEFVMNSVMGRSITEFAEIVQGKPVFHSKDAGAAYKNLRSTAKSLNFAIAYRAREKKVAKMLNCDESHAAEVIEDYYGRLPEIRNWQYEQIKRLRNTGRAWGIFGTYRALPGIYSTSKMDQWEAERMACNFPIQEGGFRIMCRGLLRLAKKWRGGRGPFQKADFPAKIKFSLHDEVVAQARRDVVEQAQADMRECLEQTHPELVGGCGIPRGVKVDMKVVEAWGT